MFIHSISDFIHQDHPQFLLFFCIQQDLRFCARRITVNLHISLIQPCSRIPGSSARHVIHHLQRMFHILIFVIRDQEICNKTCLISESEMRDLFRKKNGIQLPCALFQIHIQTVLFIRAAKYNLYLLSFFSRIIPHIRRNFNGMRIQLGKYEQIPSALHPQAKPFKRVGKILQNDRQCKYRCKQIQSAYQHLVRHQQISQRLHRKLPCNIHHSRIDYKHADAVGDTHRKCKSHMLSS